MAAGNPSIDAGLLWIQAHELGLHGRNLHARIEHRVAHVFVPRHRRARVRGEAEAETIGHAWAVDLHPDGVDARCPGGLGRPWIDGDCAPVSEIALRRLMCDNLSAPTSTPHELRELQKPAVSLVTAARSPRLSSTRRSTT